MLIVNVIMLSVVILSVVMLNVVILNVVAPKLITIISINKSQGIFGNDHHPEPNVIKLFTSVIYEFSS
jgi:hypothetical protein